MSAASWVSAAFAAFAALVSIGCAFLSRHYATMAQDYATMAQEALDQVKALTGEPDR
jgi:hypothetical protein